MLPPVKKCREEEGNFPRKWQTVIFRNYGMVSADKIAAVLSCDEEIIEREAERLGLAEEKYDPVWEERGYITIIRNNWSLLPYAQLTKLLGISEERLDFILAKEDFLYVKLGEFKPFCEEVRYAPLSREEEAETARIAAELSALPGCKKEALPFRFFNGFKGKESELRENAGVRMVHGYLTPCGDVFAEDNESYLPDALLEEYRRRGVNGLWFHGLLSSLSYYPFDERLSAGSVARRKELKKLIARCKKYGIKVYLYLNEPRGIPKDKIGKYADLIGRKEGGEYGLCLERQEVQDYLYGAVKDLVTDAKELGGIMTITMSENLTHCNFRPGTNCPICKNIPPEASAAKVNNIIMRAIRDSGTNCELIANLWGWSSFMEWSEEQTMRGIELLDKDISVMCVSEYDLKIEKGGIESKIIDYSISNPGPSEISKKIFEKANVTGHKTYAKIQINNSWECSAVPCLPVYDLIYEHLSNLAERGVHNFMLTWTLGGFPSAATGLVADFVQEGKAFSLDKWYERNYGGYAEKMRRAVRYFSEGFRAFPFSIDSLYFSPKTLGPANLWETQSSEKKSTMVCFAYDDYENWIKPYPYDVYVSQYEKLLNAWEKGMAEITDIDDEKIREEGIFARAAYIHFKSDLLQTKFSYYKRDAQKYAKQIKEVLREEREITVSLLEIVNRSALVGFETANHYFYSERNLKEKIGNIGRIERFLCRKGE